MNQADFFVSEFAKVVDQATARMGQRMAHENAARLHAAHIIGVGVLYGLLALALAVQEHGEK